MPRMVYAREPTRGDPVTLEVNTLPREPDVPDSSDLGLDPIECPECGVTTYRIVGMHQKRTRLSDKVVQITPVLVLHCGKEHEYFKFGTPADIRLPIELDEPDSETNDA